MVVAAVAVLNYAVATGAQPRLVSDGPLTPERAEDWRNDPRQVPIHDARQAMTPPGLDDAGFVLVRHPCDVAERLDADASHDGPVRRACFVQAEAIARAATSAARVVAFDWTRRTKNPPGPANTAVGAPVLRVHNDFTPRSAAETLGYVLPPDTDAGAAAGRVERYAIVSVWWPMWPVRAWPLGLVDARTVADDDLFVVQRRYPNARGETGFVAYRPAHRWFTFPAMQPDEALVFKLFDSWPGVARWTPHSAFRDPSTPAGAPARESVEVRVLVVY
jgi:hypothetical protein